MADPTSPPKKALNRSRAMAETRELMWTHRRSLAIGFALMLVNRLSGLVLPASSKYLIDNVLKQNRTDLLIPLALATGAATIVQAITSYSLAQVVSIAAQRAITDMRIQVQRHILRLPVSFFDSTKTGILISRIMTDA
ncbi:MAG: ABC transporter ATP-binding protein, partial [Gemmatimonadaceae bacterium]